MEGVAIVIGSVIMLGIIIAILSPFIINGTLTLRDKFGSSTTPAELPEQKNSEAPQSKRAFSSPPFFNNLFARLSHFKEYGIHRYIDIIVFALYKARLCATMYVSGSGIDGVTQHKIMDAYDTFQYLSLGGWMDKNAPAYTNKFDIADNRLKIYESVFFCAPVQSTALLMNKLSHSFYWILDNGWEFDAEKQTSRPSNDFDLSKIQDMAEAEQKYHSIVGELDTIVFSHCDRELPAIISFFKNDF